MKVPLFILNLPNTLSISRIFLIPLFIYLLSVPTVKSRIWAFVVFTVISITDLLDGWTARILNQETEFGKFIDPLADKFLVVSALLALFFLDPLIPLWMVLVIVGRDVLITVMRYLAIKKGRVLRTSRFGKIKTFFQMASIALIIMIYIVRKGVIKIAEADRSLFFPFFSVAEVVEIMQSEIHDRWLFVAPYWIMLFVTVITAISGLRYLYSNWRLFQKDPVRGTDEKNK